MKKLIVGLAAVGVVIALRPLVKQRVVQKMRDHCTQMAGHCREMMGGHGEATGHEAIARKMREHCSARAPSRLSPRDSVKERVTWHR